jgi:outer membrane protein assembly factor BamE
MPMRKLLIFTCAATSIILSACSTIDEGLTAIGDLGDAITPGKLAGSSLIYSPTIIQGNIVTQEQLDKLQPGMSKQQVRFILGTPTLQDTFHANRWDYNYTEGIGSVPNKISLLSVHFDNDKLIRIASDNYLHTGSEQKTTEKPAVVKVPDWEPEEKSFWDKTKQSIGLGNDEQE